MARKIKEIDEEPVEEENVGPPSPMVYAKAVFLLIIIAGGLLGIEQAAKRNARYSQAISPKIELNMESEVVQDTVEQGRDILDQTIEQAEAQKEVVLGEATEIAATAAADVKDSMLDYVYENTIEVVIQKMIDQLPEKQREEFIEEVSAQ